MKLRYDRVALADLDRILAFIADGIPPQAGPKSPSPMPHPTPPGRA